MNHKKKSGNQVSIRIEIREPTDFQGTFYVFSLQFVYVTELSRVRIDETDLFSSCSSDLGTWSLQSFDFITAGILWF